MIVELLDYRPPKGKDPLLEEPVTSHVVLSPHGESLWQDICLLNQKFGSPWTDEDTLEVESKILVSSRHCNSSMRHTNSKSAGYVSSAMFRS